MLMHFMQVFFFLSLLSIYFCITVHRVRLLPSWIRSVHGATLICSWHCQMPLKSSFQMEFSLCVYFFDIIQRDGIHSAKKEGAHNTLTRTPSKTAVWVEESATGYTRSYYNVIVTIIMAFFLLLQITSHDGFHHFFLLPTSLLLLLYL